MQNGKCKFKKIELLSLKAAESIQSITSEKVIERLGKFKQDRRKEMFSPLNRNYSFYGHDTNSMSQFKQNKLRPRLLARMTQ